MSFLAVLCRAVLCSSHCTLSDCYCAYLSMQPTNHTLAVDTVCRAHARELPCVWTWCMLAFVPFLMAAQSDVLSCSLLEQPDMSWAACCSSVSLQPCLIWGLRCRRTTCIWTLMEPYMLIKPTAA